MDIDDIIDEWPQLIPLPGLDTERQQLSGVFREDLVQLWHINYEYLRDYRSPYADITVLWEGTELEDHDVMADANEEMRTAQMWADLIDDMEEDGEIEVRIVSSAPDLPIALELELDSCGI